MRQFDARRTFSWLGLGLSFLIALSACGSGGDSGSAGGAPPAVGGMTITGTVTAPGGTVAKTTTTPLRWFASLFVEESHAQAIGSFVAVTNATVIAFQIDDQGNPIQHNIAGLADPIILSQTTTTATGTYSLTLPGGFTPGVNTVIQASSAATPVGIAAGTNAVQALVTGSTVNINPVTRASALVLVNYLEANPGSTLTGAFTALEVIQLVSVIQIQTAANMSLVGNTVSVTITNIRTGLQAFTASAVANIAGPGQDPVNILTTTIPAGTVGQPYSAQMLAMGGVGTYSWSTVPANALQPFGLSINATSGLISGTPNAPSTSTPITIQISASSTDQQVVTLTINGGGGGLPSNIAIATGPGEQLKDPQIVSDGAGGAIMVWATGDNIGTRDIYAQRLNSAGVVQWAANGVPITSGLGDQATPQLVSDGASGAVIAWRDSRSGRDINSDIYAQRINSAGIAQWAANGIPITTAVSRQQEPRLASDGAGGAIVVWEDLRNSTSQSDVYVQRVNSSGVVQWTVDGVPIETSNGRGEFPQITGDGAGGAIIAWVGDFVNDQSRVRAQRVSGAGAIQWAVNGIALTNFASVLGSPLGGGGAPHLINDSAGGAIIAWAGSGQEGSGIRAQRVNSNGVPQWVANGVVINPANLDLLSNQPSPIRLSEDGSDGAIVVWPELRNGANFDIHAQRINDGGVLQWAAEGIAVSTPAGNQEAPQIAGDGSGGAVVIWQDKRTVTDFDVYAQRVNSAGQVQWTENGVALTTATGNQEFPQLTGDGAGGAFVVWQDARTGASSSDIYAQRINGSGVLQ